MGKSIVVNKLVLGSELMGYRFDIKEGNNRIVSLDLDKDSVKSFLSLVEKDKIVKGYVIKGKVVGDMFVTANEENVVQVTGKNQALELLGEYYYGNSSDSIDGLLDSISFTKDDANSKRIKEFFSTPSATLKSVDHGDYGYVPLVYNLINKSAEGLKYRVDVDEVQDEDRSYVMFEIYFSRLEDVIKYFKKYFSLRKYYGCSIVVPKVVADSLKGCTPVGDSCFIKYDASNLKDLINCISKFNLVEEDEFDFQIEDMLVRFNDGIYTVTTYALAPGYDNEKYDIFFNEDEYGDLSGAFNETLCPGKGLFCTLPDLSDEVFSDDEGYEKGIGRFKNYLEGVNCSVDYLKPDNCDIDQAVFRISTSSLEGVLLYIHRAVLGEFGGKCNFNLLDSNDNIVFSVEGLDFFMHNKDLVKLVKSYLSKNSLIGTYKLSFTNGGYINKMVCIDGEYFRQEVPDLGLVVECKDDQYNFGYVIDLSTSYYNDDYDEDDDYYDED